MLQFLKTRWQLLIVLILFIICKLTALHYPFFLDESWSYAPGVKLMYLHGPSLMPNAIDLFYSRGHPLLFYASAAAWMKVFGSSHVAQHAFALFISVLLVIAVYEVSLRIYGKRSALFSLLLLPLQVMFFVQSTMLLPELMIGLLALLTLFFYTKGKYVFAFLCCTALIFTKESGMVLGVVLGIHAVVNLLNKKEALNSRIMGFLSIFCAGLVIAGFYLLQKSLNGWYLFPEHTGMIVWDWAVAWKKIQFSLEVLFYHDYRFRMFQVLLMLGIVVAIHLKDIRYATPLIPAYLIYSIIEDRFSFMPRQMLLVIMLLSLVYAVYQLVVLSDFKEAITKRFSYLGVFFFIAYLCFCSINFFTARYLDCVLVIVLMLAAAYFTVYISKLYDTIFYITVACLALAGFYGYKYDTGLTDVDLGAFDAMKVQQDVVGYMEREKLQDKQIFASFINSVHLQKPYTGFLQQSDTFRNVGAEITGGTEYLIIDNIDSVRQTEYIRNNKDYHIVHRAQTGKAWAEVYKK